VYKTTKKTILERLEVQMQQTRSKQQQQLQIQDGEQVEEDEPQTGTMTHHNELARKRTKTVPSNLICKLVKKQSFKMPRIFGSNLKYVI
jgi:hypothetical protein